MRDMNNAGRRGFALVLAIMIAAAAVMLVACGGKESGGSGSGSGGTEEEEITSSGGISGIEGNGKVVQEEFNTETAKVTGKCYVLAGMSYEDEEYDEEVIKDIFDIRDITKYMTVYFEKGGTAYVSSLLYGDEVEKGKWGEDTSDGVTVLQVEDDLYEIETKDDGTLQTYSNEEDGEGFLLTLREPEEVPEVLKDYVK